MMMMMIWSVRPMMGWPLTPKPLHPYPYASTSASLSLYPLPLPLSLYPCSACLLLNPFSYTPLCLWVVDLALNGAIQIQAAAIQIQNNALRRYCPMPIAHLSMIHPLVFFFVYHHGQHCHFIYYLCTSLYKTEVEFAIGEWLPVAWPLRLFIGWSAVLCSSAFIMH